MRIWMLGWAPCPRLSGGVGLVNTALAWTLARRGVDVSLVVTEAPGDQNALNEMPDLVTLDLQATLACDHCLPPQPLKRPDSLPYTTSPPSRLTLKAIPSWLEHPYLTSDPAHAMGTNIRPALQHGRWTGPATIADSGSSLVYARTDLLYAMVMDHVNRVLDQAARDPHPIDLIHAHDWLTFPAAAALAVQRCVPWIAHVHSLESNRRGVNDAVCGQIRTFEERGLRAATHVVAVSERIRGQLIEQYHLPPQKITVCHPAWIDPIMARQLPGLRACDLQPFTWQPTIEAYATDGPMVLLAGRLVGGKGLERLATLIEHVHARDASVRFVLAGEPATPRDRDILTRLQYEHDILWVGYVPWLRMHDLCARADAFVLLSDNEPFGLVALEAAAAGTPVLIAGQAGVCELLDQACRVPAERPQMLAEALCVILQNPERTRNLSRLGSQPALGRTWETCADEIQRLYGRCVSGSIPANPIPSDKV